MTKIKTETPKQINEDSTTSKMRKALEATLAAFKSGAIHTCSECYRDEWDDELSNLKAMVELALEAPPQPVPNVAAMRDALEEAVDIIRCYDMSEQDGEFANQSEEVGKWFENVNAVFEKPPRNCDRFNTGDVVKDADDALHAILEEGAIGFRSVAQYLLSPAGEGNKPLEETNHEQ